MQERTSVLAKKKTAMTLTGHSQASVNQNTAKTEFGAKTWDQWQLKPAKTRRKLNGRMFRWRKTTTSGEMGFKSQEMTKPLSGYAKGMSKLKIVPETLVEVGDSIEDDIRLS